MLIGFGPALLSKTLAALPKVFWICANKFFTSSSFEISVLIARIFVEGLITFNSSASLLSARRLRAVITIPFAPALAHTLAAA